MNYDQVVLSIILGLALIAFISNIVRYDVVASVVLLLTVFFGLIPVTKTFSGFSHSAVITVAAIFVISRAVETSGILSEIANFIRLRKKNIPKQNLALCSMVVALSAFINNVGAVALMIPITLKIARIKNIPRQQMLMPLAFSSLIGGLITLIGTPPNIIISDYRKKYLGEAFYFFDFAPVGLGLAVIGVLFISYWGWKLIPLGKTSEEKKPTEKFTVELKVKPHSTLINKKVASLLNDYEDKIELLAMVREEEVIRENLGFYTVFPGDSFILETDKWTVNELISQYKLSAEYRPQAKNSKSKPHFLSEITVLPQSPLLKKPIEALKLPESYGIEVIAVSRRNTTITERIKALKLKPGDGLLVKSEFKISPDILEALNGVFLEEKHIRPFSKTLSIKVATIFGIALFAIILNLVRVDVAFFAAAVMMVITGCLSLNRAYQSINLPIIVLIAALIPVGEAMESTGTAKLLGTALYYYGQVLPIGLNLFFLILVAMLLSNLINNAAVALIFAPIALQIAADWGAAADPFLMGVAIGSSCTFLTPVGHQSNTLILGPGNYRFSDYWLMGLPLTLIIAIIGTLLIMLFWPFY
ncbi:SLC13 family permease [Legionella impletisoli]|uniref:Permease n=1 Tax=Legionella impletisoli TaxID=343510 RepID=A0A917JQQ7_9GAMM|nr:SLC13 family permease [Legionella impletisoli]GGI81783.1 permease [Legionella impletisoli]